MVAVGCSRSILMRQVLYTRTLDDLEDESSRLELAFQPSLVETIRAGGRQLLVARCKRQGLHEHVEKYLMMFLL